MNDLPGACQSRAVTEPQRDSGASAPEGLPEYRDEQSAKDSTYPNQNRRGRPLCRPANPPARFPRLYGQDNPADVVIIVKNGLPNLANSPNFFPSALHLLTFRFRIVIFICRGTGNVSGNDSENALRRISVCLGELWRSDDKGYCEGLRRERKHRVARPQ